MKTKFPKLILLLISLFSPQIFCSCITIGKIDSMYIENPENYEGQITERKYFSHGFFSFLSAPKPVRAFNWNEYSLEMYETQKNESGWDLKKKESVSTKGIFKKNGEQLFCTEISSNSVKTKTLWQYLWPFDECADFDTSVKITTGKENNQVFLIKNSDFESNEEGESLALEDDALIPVKIFRVKKSVGSDDKTHNTITDTAGFRIQIFDENYAVLDTYSAKTKVKLNKTFSKPLSEDKKDYITSLILLFWDYYYEFECDGITAKSTKKINGWENTKQQWTEAKSYIRNLLP